MEKIEIDVRGKIFTLETGRIGGRQMVQ